MAADLKYEVEVATQNAQRALENLGRRVERLNDDFGQFNQTVTRFSTVLAGTLTAAGVAAARFADQMTDIAAANETTVASVIGLSKALAQSGGNADAAARLFQTFANNIEAANSGNLKTLQTFERLGISITDLGRMSQEELRGKVLKALTEIRDPAQRNAIAMDMFGKAIMGVDLKTFTAEIDRQTQKYSEYQGQIETAGAAFDKMAAILTDLKVAAAIAFEPLFKVISQLNIDVKDLTVLFRIMAAALVASVSAAVLGGFVKLLTIMKELNTVVSKNKLITIIGAILAVASGASAYLGLTKESVDEQEKLNKEVDKTKNITQETQRDQQGLLDVIKKQRDSLTQVTEQYFRQRQSAQSRLDLELESLNLSEEQRRVKQETAQIEEQTQSALLSLKQKYEALDEASRKNRAQDYARERDLIIQNGEAAKRATEERIRTINSERAILEDLQKQYSVYTDARVKLLEKVARAEIEAGRFQDRASQEEKLNTILAQRARLMEAVAKSNLSPEDQEKIKKAIADATGNTKLMQQGFQDIQRSIEGAILATEGLSETQRQAANDILLNTQNSRNTITAVGEAMAVESQRIQDYQRSFTTGWSRAFQQYADDATNAAKRAEQIFTKVTQGLEDAFVNFAKTGKLSFRDLINSIIEDLLRSQIRQLLAQTFNFGGGAGGGSNIFSSIGKIFGFASGGVVPGNKPILVGERGPEIFMPPGAGNIIPNNQLGGGATIYYNISAVDARSFQELVARDPQFIYAVTEQGRRSLPQTRR